MKASSESGLWAMEISMVSAGLATEDFWLLMGDERPFNTTTKESLENWPAALKLSFCVGFLCRIGSRTGALRRPKAASSALGPDVMRHPGGCNQQRRKRNEKYQQ
jgi:hypothetical protein